MSNEPISKRQAAGTILLIALLTYRLAKAVAPLWALVSPHASSLWSVWWFNVLGTLVVLMIGVGLFLFRKHYRIFYGLCEVGFAISVGWISLARAHRVQDATSWIAVVAAAYLVVRGLDNYEEGRKEAIAGK
jgi:hypothetical protein